MATSNTYENVAQCKTCRCGEGDTNIWTTRSSDNPDKQIQKCPNCQVLKSGPLFLSSKGIGWTSWKKRWFILTRTSLVFYRTDPNAAPQKGNEANLTLGGIDLNNLGSVVVKADKKLLTVLFPDGRDGRTFTLKAETSEDLYDWKTALENALAQAPTPAFATGQNGIFLSDVPDSLEASFEQWRDRRPAKSLVVGRPILLALEDIDGSPSFLEKALRFIEEYGIKVEGILRQSADVDEVERRVREYEQGIVEFTPDEDAHVVADCIKHILRELPSSPVPATCCTALVEAYRTDRGSRINAMRAAIAETFPEPNRRLVQRILKMMLTVASHKSVNRMTLSAVAACMAPLLLRPLLAGDCELEDDFNMGGDGSIQLLQAAAAANHAQAIVIILLEEYERIFDEDLLQEGSLSSDLYSESEDADVEDEESTDNDILDDDGCNDPDNGREADIEDDSECSSSEALSENNSDADSGLYKGSDDQNSYSSSLLDNEVVEVTQMLSNTMRAPELQHTSTGVSLPQHVGVQNDEYSQSGNNNSAVDFNPESSESSIKSANTTKSSTLSSVSQALPSSIANCTDKSTVPLPSIKRRTVWGRTSARKNLSMESIDLSIDFSSEDEISIQRLEATKSKLQTKIAKEIKGNEILQASLGKRKELLHERRLALEQDVERLQEQLQKEIDLRTCLETGLMNLQPGQFPIKSCIDRKTRADLEELALAEADIDNLKQKVTNLSGQLLNHQLQHSISSLCESCSQQFYAMYQSTGTGQQKVVCSTTLVHQNENSINNEEVSSGLAVENVHARKQDSPSSLNRESFWEQRLTSEIQNTTISSSESKGSQSTELSAIAKIAPPQNSAIAKTAPPQSSSANNENASFVANDEKAKAQIQDSMIGTEHENMRIQSQDSPSSPDKQPSEKLQTNITNQRSRKCTGSINVSSTEPTTLGSNTSSKKSSPRVETGKKEHALSKMSGSRNENSMNGQGCENVKTQYQDCPPSPNTHSPQKLQPNTTKQSSTRSSGPDVSSIEEPMVFLRSTASKRSSFQGETGKKEILDPLSSTSRLLSQKPQPNTTHLNSIKSPGSSSLSLSEETTTINRNAAFKRSSTRAEETSASASSALAKLTNRLNFLKERRVQLANELQNLDANRTSGPEGPPRTSSR